jgi:hypothetical protein
LTAHKRLRPALMRRRRQAAGGSRTGAPLDRCVSAGGGVRFLPYWGVGSVGRRGNRTPREREPQRPEGARTKSMLDRKGLEVVACKTGHT